MILGVLAAVVVFAVGAFNKNGLQAACKTDFKTVQIADEAYYAQNNSTYAPVANDATSLVTAGYLKSVPGNTGSYTIALSATGPTVTLTSDPSHAYTTADGCSGLAGS